MTDSILAPIAALALPDSIALVGSANKAVAFVETMAVTNVEEYGFAADELKSIKARSAKLESQRTAITGPINAGLKAVNDLFRAPMQLLGHCEQLLKGKMLTFDIERERLQREELTRAEAIAAAERKRLAEEAASRQREADAAAQRAREAAAAGDRQAAALAQAEAQRKQAESNAAETTAQLVVAAPAVVEMAKASGISTSTKLDFEVTSLLELVQHVAAHPELINLLKADDVKLRAYVKGLGTAAALPGVRVFEARVMSARAA